MRARRTALFVYGSLMRDDVRVSLTGRRFTSFPATLHGYARRFPAHLGGFPDIAPSRADQVEGLLLEGIDDTALRTLDRYEELGRLYTRRPVHVTARGTQVPCQAYVGIPPRRRARGRGGTRRRASRASAGP